MHRGELEDDPRIRLPSFWNEITRHSGERRKNPSTR